MYVSIYIYAIYICIYTRGLRSAAALKALYNWRFNNSLSTSCATYCQLWGTAYLWCARKLQTHTVATTIAILGTTSNLIATIF